MLKKFEALRLNPRFVSLNWILNLKLKKFLNRTLLEACRETWGQNAILLRFSSAFL